MTTPNLIKLQLLAMTALLSACAGSNYDFSKVESNGSLVVNPTPTPQSCSNLLQNITVPVKVLFSVDMSGSNVSGDFGSSPTDPQKAMRAGSIQQFVTDFGQRSNFSWGFFAFNANAATPLFGSPLALFSGATDMQNALNAFNSMTDTGNTPYAVALDMAYQGIMSDPGLTNGTKYIVVFLSDGMPNPAVTSDQVVSTISNIVNLSPNNISFSTVYYGQSDANAANLMKQMADAGHGYFLDTNSNPTGKTFKIADIITIPGVKCE